MYIKWDIYLENNKFSTKVELYLPCTQRTYGSPAFPGGHLHTGLPRSLLHSAPSPHGLYTEQGSARQPALLFGFPVNPLRQRQRDRCPLGVQSVLVPHVLSAHGSNLQFM